MKFQEMLKTQFVIFSDLSRVFSCSVTYRPIWCFVLFSIQTQTSQQRLDATTEPSIVMSARSQESRGRHDACVNGCQPVMMKMTEIFSHSTPPRTSPGCLTPGRLAHARPVTPTLHRCPIKVSKANTTKTYKRNTVFIYKEKCAQCFDGT